MLMEYRRGRIPQEYRRWGRLARLVCFRAGATHVTPEDDNLRASSGTSQRQGYCGCGGAGRNISSHDEYVGVSGNTRSVFRASPGDSLYRKTVEVVGECNRTGKAVLYFCLRLILFSQSPQHSMRQNQLLDMSIRGPRPVVSARLPLRLCLH
jgi:hypothetical protein